MKKYNIYYKYENNKYTVICPELFGFVLYIKEEKDILKETLRVLRIYTYNKKLTAGNLNIEKHMEEEICL